MRIKLLAASLVLVFVFAIGLSLGFTQTAMAGPDPGPDCNCNLVYCLDPPGQVYLLGKLHPGERPECQPNNCVPYPCN